MYSQALIDRFFYITPKKYPELVRHFLGNITDNEIKKIYPIGNSPVLLPKADLTKLVGDWMDLSIAIKKHPPSNKEWGWVLEMVRILDMQSESQSRKASSATIGIIPCLALCHFVQYGYTLASFKNGVKYDLHPEFECQPPWDKDLSDFYFLHFTYGNDYTLDGKFTPGKVGEWRFDKRSYTNRFPPKNLDLPPKGVPETVVTLIEKINEASANSPYWQGNGGYEFICIV